MTVWKRSNLNLPRVGEKCITSTCLQVINLKVERLHNVQGNMIQINKTLLVMKGIIRRINFCYAVLESTLIFEVNFGAFIKDIKDE